MSYYAHVPFSFLHPATSNECIDVFLLVIQFRPFIGFDIS